MIFRIPELKKRGVSSVVLKEAAMKYKTRGSVSPQGKPRVYFTGHPADVKQHFESITSAILKLHNCAVFYDEDPEHPEDGENFLSDLDRMQLIVVAVTGRYVYGDTFAHNTVFRHAMARHIPVLPILEESGIERDFDKKCGNLQYLDPNARDNTAISFEDKLKKLLDSVLVGDELAAKVREAFDAYVFLSYRKKDRRYAQQLMRLIHENPFCRDIAIWYDEFLVPGEDFNDAIRKAMEKSELFALVVTPNLLEDSNYIMSTEYPAARESGKPILPAVLVPTDGRELAARYEDIPTPIDPAEEGALPAALRAALANVISPENDDEPRHIFFIGLAYLGGIDVEVNYEFAVQLITRAAEAGLPEAMDKLVSMYRTGEGVERDYHTAIRWQEKLVQVRRAAYMAAPTEKGGAQWFDALLDLGNFWYELRQFDHASKAYHEMLEASHILDEMYHARWTQRTLSVSYSKRGDIGQAQGDLFAAKVFYKKSFAIRERLTAGTDTVSYNKLGDMAEAKDLHERILAICAQLKSEIDAAQTRRDLSISYRKLGDISRAQGNLYEAKAFYEKSLIVSERLAAETGTVEARWELSFSYEKLGDISRAQGNLTGAKEFYEKSLAIRERLAAETGTVEARQGLAANYQRLGDVSRARGDLSVAKAFYEKCLAICERLAAETGTVEARWDLAIGYERLGNLSLMRGDLAGAKAFHEKCLAIRERLVAETGTVEARRDLADSYKRMGDISQAQDDLAGAWAFYEKGLAIDRQLAEEAKAIRTYDCFL